MNILSRKRITKCRLLCLKRKYRMNSYNLTFLIKVFALKFQDPCIQEFHTSQDHHYFRNCRPIQSLWAWKKFLLYFYHLFWSWCSPIWCPYAWIPDHEGIKQLPAALWWAFWQFTSSESHISWWNLEDWLRGGQWSCRWSFKTHRQSAI